MKIFAPYLSKTLRRRIDLTRSCEADWFRQFPGNRYPQDSEYVVKAPFAWGEGGLFSGQDERAAPLKFHIERAELGKDGSFRVYVRLKWWEVPTNQSNIWHTSADRPAVWGVAALVVREGDHFVVDDVIYLKDENSSPLAPAEERLSRLLSQGCDGPHWVGYR